MESNKVCGIFLGGEPFNKPFLEERIKKLDYIIAADSGCDMLLSFGRFPDLFLGDMDSVTEETLDRCRLQNVEILNYPAAKDFTDGEMALSEAATRGYTNLEIYAAYGDRFDHTMANIFTAVSYAQKGMQIKFINKDFTAYLSNGELTVNGEKGDLISILPLSEKVSGVMLEGFLYALNKEELRFTSARGVSNIMETATGHIKHESGILLVIHYPKKEGNF